MKELGVVAAVAAVLMASSAGATVQTYDVSGTFMDGADLSGGFSFNDQASSFLSGFSNVSVMINGGGRSLALTQLGGLILTGGSGARPIDIRFADSASDSVDLSFVANYDTALRSINSGALLTSGPVHTDYQYATYLPSGGGFFTYNNLANGTISPHITSAVPEPATWALMIMGVGVAGIMKRRRDRQRVLVSFA